MSILNSGIVPVGSTGYDIPYSARFNDDDSAYLSRTPSVAGNRKTWTWSGWVKLGVNGNSQRLFGSHPNTSNLFGILVNAAGDIFTWSNLGGAASLRHTTSDLLRDPSAWYHLTFVLDTTQATATNRFKAYKNGTLMTTSAYTAPALNSDQYINATTAQWIGKSQYSGYYDGYLAEVNFVDGQALTPADFGETDATYGHWKPIEYTGSYGTNGFYIDFKDSGSLGNDANGSNNWTPTNLAATDQMLDSPTNNFATFNAVVPQNVYGGTNALGGSLLEGNLRANTAAGQWNSFVPTITMDSDSSNYYYEVYVLTVGTSNDVQLKVQRPDLTGSVGVNSSGNFIAGDIIGFTVGSNTIKWYKNGTLQATISSALSGLYYMVFAGANACQIIANFGQDSSFAGNKTAQGNQDSNSIGDFYYTPPTGFLALCTQNLPEPTVVPSEHFNTVTYTGTGSSASHTIGFRPNLVWGKKRNAAQNNWLINDVGDANKWLSSDGTGAEGSEANGTTFDTNGFTTASNDLFYNNGGNYVVWSWKGNGTGTAVSNTDGSIESTVSANVDAGFSIVSYTGTGSAGTIGHGLSSAPEMVILKGRDFADNWYVWHEALAATEVIRLDITNAKVSSDLFSNTEPTASVFSIKAGYNLTGRDFITYCFHSVEGYSKVGSYTGNGSADGTFVHCGFRPAYVMIKKTDAVGSWHTIDAERIGYNPRNDVLLPDSNSAEQTNYGVQARDILSNGFKMRDPNGGTNASGGTFIFLAFAETPFKYTNAR